MKTTELIKQAEELLGKCSSNPWESDPLDEERAMRFSRNHMQEIIDRLKKYEEALQKIKAASKNMTVPYKKGQGVDLLLTAYEALEEECHR